MIIDTHSHLGECNVFGANQSAEALLLAMSESSIDCAVVQPFPGAPDVVQVHDAIFRLSQETSGKVRGLASINPHIDVNSYRSELKRCVEELGFVGVKLHSIGHSVSPGSKAARLIFTSASELKIPVMIHTGAGIPFADPIAWVALAKEFSDVSVVLAHAGASLFTEGAIVAAEVCSNVYLETSWCNPQDIRKAHGRVGDERLMFGSDMVFNVKAELVKYESVGFKPDSHPAIFQLNAQRIFGL